MSVPAASQEIERPCGEPPRGSLLHCTRLVAQAGCPAPGRVSSREPDTPCPTLGTAPTPTPTTANLHRLGSTHPHAVPRSGPQPGSVSRDALCRHPARRGRRHLHAGRAAWIAQRCAPRTRCVGRHARCRRGAQWPGSGRFPGGATRRGQALCALLFLFSFSSSVRCVSSRRPHFASTSQ